MGLLEDAIREHLELKRLRGADPTEVAREQHEVLDAPSGQRPGGPVEDRSLAAEADAAADELDPHGPAAVDRPDEVPQAPVAEDSPHAAQETAELDMQAVLADETSTRSEHAVPTDTGLDERRGASAATEDSLEWEEPARPAHEPDSDPGLHARDREDEAGAGEHGAPPESGEELEDQPAGARRNDPGQGRLSL